MGSDAIHVLSAGRHSMMDPILGHPDHELWLSETDLECATGWKLKPEGLCRDDQCAMGAPPHRARFVVGQAVCASGLWESLGRPVLHDEAGASWILGESAADRSRALESLEAPDFTLPDIHGNLYSLSDFRGQKVLLATWASW